MATPLEALPEQVRKRAITMRDIVRTIESAPLNEVVTAIENLKAEIEALLADALKASPVRRL
jgi:flagellar basal body-associated protein FliL